MVSLGRQAGSQIGGSQAYDLESRLSSSAPRVVAEKAEDPVWLPSSPDPSLGWRLIHNGILEPKSRENPSFDGY